MAQTQAQRKNSPKRVKVKVEGCDYLLFMDGRFIGMVCPALGYMNIVDTQIAVEIISENPSGPTTQKLIMGESTLVYKFKKDGC